MKQKNRTIEYTSRDKVIYFETLPDLFSPKSPDPGSKILIDLVLDQKFDYQSALDWGCGWGLMSIVLAKNNPNSLVTTIDSDIAAVKITKLNAEKNNIKNLEVIASYGYDEINKNKKFDLILSHPPTHRGRQIVEDMIHNSALHLENNGRFLIVVEARLKSWIMTSLKQNFRNPKLLKRTSKYVILEGRH